MIKKINKKSVTRRVLIGVLIGLIVSVIYILVFKFQGGYDVFSRLSFGTILIFVIMGALTGFAGMYTKHPVFGFKLTWYIRGAFIGTLVALAFIFLSYEEFKSVIESPLISWTGIESPFWALIDGAFVGMFMGYMETKMVGEGKELKF